LGVACDGTEPVVATHLGFVAQPASSVTSMESLGSVSVVFLGDDGSVAPASQAVEVSLASNDQQASLSGATAAVSANGLASFSDLKVDKVGASYRLVAKAVGFDSVVSQPFAITRGPASTFRFASPIQGVTAGGVIAPVMVDVTDAGGNVIPDATTPIQIVLPGVVGPAVPTLLNGTVTKSAVAGRATFDDLSTCAVGAHTLVASAPGLISSASNQFNVGIGAMTKLVFQTQPAGAKASVALPAFGVRAADPCGNAPPLPPGGPMTVVLSLGANPGGATLSGTLSITGFLAAVSFNDVTIDKPGSGYTLVATVSGSPNLTPGTSTTFVISP